ncbi:MAG TPA: DsbA family protein [Patescibacteria group bacterium]|jgi:protein-disulfide isomerase|nr:DsbA family protein [Patescibacteria group bacterium]
MPKRAAIKKSSLPTIKIPTFEVKIKLPVIFKKLENVNWKRFLPKSSNQVMVVLLVVAAFLVGYLLNEVQHLQKTQVAIQAAVPSQQAGQQAAPTPGAKVNVSAGHFPILGNAKAKVTIIEFADFRCPFCEQFFTNTLPQITKDYVDTGKVKLAFRNFAFLGDPSTVAADASECANDQGKFWDFYNYLYKNQPAETDTTMYNTDTLTQAAVSLGMNDSQFRSCLDNKTDDAKAAKDMADGQAAGVSGTPTFFVNGISIVGAQPYSAFQQLIDQELAKTK